MVSPPGFEPGIAILEGLWIIQLSYGDIYIIIKLGILMVRMARIELARSCLRKILSLVRLPIPPHSHIWYFIYTEKR